MAEFARKVKGGLLVGDIDSVKVEGDTPSTDTPSPKKTRKPKETKSEE